MLETLKAGEWRYPLALTLMMGLALCAGFLSVSSSLGRAIPFAFDVDYLEKVKTLIGFPVLAGLFYLSVPSRASHLPAGTRWEHPWKTFALPILISLVFGWFHPSPPLLQTLRVEPDRAWVWLTWYVLFIPLGEEWLFRGWMYNLFERLWPGKFLTATNPLPVSVWMTSVAFSLWHWQNLGTDPLPLVALQATYTFFTGLWLACLRWQYNSIIPAIGAHATLNLAASLL